MKIAVYKHLEYGFESPSEVDEYTEGDDERLRVSEIVDVDFQMIPDIDLVGAQVSAIDKAIEKERADSNVRINSMQQRKQELLAIGSDEDKS